MVSQRPRGEIRGALWNRWPCEARCVEVVVGQTSWTWCQPLIGTLRRGIEVQMDGQTVYVDNQDGKALAVFLKGKAPIPGFRLLPAFAVFDDPKAAEFYQANLTQ